MWHVNASLKFLDKKSRLPEAEATEYIGARYAHSLWQTDKTNPIDRQDTVLDIHTSTYSCGYC